MKKTVRGFTLIELLVVIAIIAILAAVMMLTLNPLQIMMRGRDGTRLADLATMQQAITLAISESSESAETLACFGGVCEGDSKTDSAANRAINGTGWVKINFKSQSAVSIPVLPIDPSNGTTYYYKYCGNGANWMIKAKLESDQYKPKMISDGDGQDSTYAVGSDMTMTGACTY